MCKKFLLPLLTSYIPFMAFSATDVTDLPQILSVDDSVPVDSIPVDSIELVLPKFDSVTDSLLFTVTDVDTLMSMAPLPASFFIIPPVFDTFVYPDPRRDAFEADYSGSEALRWIEDLVSIDRRKRQHRQYMAVNTPYAIEYNVRTLPEPPQEVVLTINPKDYTLESVMSKSSEVLDQSNIAAPEIKKKHWIRNFRASLQFSQAYISPNWYQGGNNNLNGILDIVYNVKLNEKFHPNYLFESNFSYKLGINSAPDDPARDYTISEDIFLATATFGIKAIKKWYYSLNANFKTQLLNSYNKGTNDLRAALLAPGELNVGLGMTYGTSNKKGTCKFDATINPVSYNLMMCYNDRLNVTAFNIEEGHKTSNKIGSSAELKLAWKIAHNISLNSRLFAFTDYSRAYADLENTMIFEINKYLTTQIYAHLRYDTNTPYVEPDWHKLQVKEIFSLGVSYKFSTI
ncbi:MAG: DUF3078 domain-containing protein [Muribaculaceae bacterium]|nr:DUF3078 domain-containing protein [Muribaculaceae bacterium]